MRDEPHGDWCVLRTSAPQTLKLTASLRQAGYEAWTPTAQVGRRFRRGSKAKVYRDAPIAPTFVFAAYDHVGDLGSARLDPARPHPAFSIFRHLGSPVRIRDGELAQLRDVEAQHRRQAERRAAAEARGKAEPFATGTIVPLIRGAWTGLEATVEHSDRRSTWLAIGTTMRVKIDTSILRQDSVAMSASAA